MKRTLSHDTSSSNGHNSIQRVRVPQLLSSSRPNEPELELNDFRFQQEQLEGYQEKGKGREGMSETIDTQQDRNQSQQPISSTHSPFQPRPPSLSHLSLRSSQPSDDSPVVIGASKPLHTLRIERDWSLGTETVRFWDGWNTELDGRLKPIDFQEFMNGINEILAEAFDPRKSVLDNVLAILTLYTSTFLLKSHYTKVSTQLLLEPSYQF